MTSRPPKAKRSTRNDTATTAATENGSQIPSDTPVVRITYDFFDLPTALHKAGLAGLLLHVKSMSNRQQLVPKIEPDAEFSTTKVTIDFTEATVQSLFDDLYDATLDEGPVRERPFTKGTGANKQEVPPLRRQSFTKTDKKGNEKTVEGYVYNELTPSLATLTHFLPKEGEWVKLWRDLIWQIIREGKKKAPYNKRAAKKKELQQALAVADAADAADDADSDAGSEDQSETSRGDGSTWDDLLKFAKKGADAQGKLSGAMLLGAMEKNAESLTLQGRIDQNLLLHFWPLAVMVFVPVFVDSEGETHMGRRGKKESDPHYCIAVPEVCDLERFVEDFPRMLQSLSPEKAGFRPRDALIDVPAEGAFAFIEHLAALVPGSMADSQVRQSISAIDYFHVTKAGNNVKFMAIGRVVPRRHLVEDYQGIRGRLGEKPPFGNPLFRRGLLVALLNDSLWYQPFGELFQELPAKFFVQSEKSPSRLSWFWTDARKKFQQEMIDMSEENDPESPPPDDKLLATLLHRIVRTYLMKQAEVKSGIDISKFRKGDAVDWDALPPQYSEARRKAGESLFLELRSRRDQAFIDHFTRTLFATKQFLSESHYSRVGLALLNQTDDVKTLTLMALSANS
jgi:CRISPR-associated protein Cmx8